MNPYKTNPEEYMNFLKEDFKQNCINDYGFSESNAEEFIEIIFTYIQRLKNVRDSKSRTDAITDELIKYSRNPNFPFFEDYNKLCIISYWLTKALWVDPTYHYARTRLGYDQNWKSDLVIYDVMGEYVSPPEILQLLKTEAELNNKENATLDIITNTVDYSEHLNALSKYISGINVVEFTNIIEQHSLTIGTPKARWEGLPADAHRFATFFKMKLPAFNKCFSLSIGRKLRHNDKNETISPINAILKAHFNK